MREFALPAVAAILAWAVEKMEERYSLLARAGVRHITSYNQLGEKEIINRLAPESEEECQNIPFKIPFVVIVADEHNRVGQTLRDPSIVEQPGTASR